MNHKTLILLLLILFFTDSLQISGRSSRRAFKLEQSFDVVNHQDMVYSRNDEILVGRMLIETDDYPGTGANTHHDPKSPGTR